MEITPETHPDLFGPVEPSPARAQGTTFALLLQALAPPSPPITDEDGNVVPNPFPSARDMAPEDRARHRSTMLAWRVGLAVQRRGRPDTIPNSITLRPLAIDVPMVRDYASFERLDPSDPRLVDPTIRASEIVIREALHYLGEDPPPHQPDILQTWPPPSAWQYLHDSWILYAYENLPLDKTKMAARLLQHLPDMTFREAMLLAEKTIEEILDQNSLSDQDLRRLLVQRALQEANSSDKPIPAIKLVAELRGLLKTEKDSSLKDLVSAMLESKGVPPGPKPIEATPVPTLQPNPNPKVPQLNLPALRMKWPDHQP